MDTSRVRTTLSFPAALAWSVCGLVLALVACAYALLILNRRADAYDFLWPIDVVLCAFVGAVVSSRRPTNPVGWFFLVGAATLALQEVLREYAVYGLLTDPGSLPLAQATAWLLSWIYVPGFFLLICFLPLYFPDGRLLSPRWRWVAGSALFITAAMTLNSAFLPGEIKTTGFINPLGIEALEPLGGLLDNALFVGGFAIVFISVASLVVRFRRSEGEERQQIKWLVYAASAVPVWFLVSPAVDIPILFTAIEILLVACVPVAAGIAILKYRLYDIDVVINRTLVYGVLTVCVAGIYVLVVGYLGATFGVDGSLSISLIATGIVAVLFAPLRVRLQRAVNRLMYGERDEPYAAISRLGERLEATLAPDAVLPTITQTVREALKLPYAAIALGVGTDSILTAESGSPVDTPVRVPLVYRGMTTGELLLGPRAGEGSFSPADRRLLEDLARQAGAAVHAVRLTSDLQNSRERLVTTREEERRRLRRDLHDGLGPALGSLPLKLDVAGDLMESDPAAARELLRGLKSQTRSAVADIRRLVYELRPPALDELGLIGAVRETAAQHGAGGLLVSVEAPEELPPLPAAVEVAAYRIMQEAMTNVVRHAGANWCEVRIALDDATLRLEVTDAGRGIGADRGFSVGLHSMRERAEELGGRFEVESVPDDGTCIGASLPLARSIQEPER